MVQADADSSFRTTSRVREFRWAWLAGLWSGALSPALAFPPATGEAMLCGTTDRYPRRPVMLVVDPIGSSVSLGRGSSGEDG
jgi:hypothetical protein